MTTQIDTFTKEHLERYIEDQMLTTREAAEMRAELQRDPEHWIKVGWQALRDWVWMSLREEQYGVYGAEKE